MKIADLFAMLRLKPDKASFEAGNKLITGIKVGLGALAAWQGFSWAKSTIEQVVDLGSKISDLSQQVGVPAETLQQLGYAAQLSGGSMESLGNSLGKLAKKASDAGKGSKEAAAVFQKMGISVKEADGSLRPAEDLLGDIADHIAAMPDGTEKTALAMDVFGRSGKELIPLLNEGGDGIAKLREEFVALGGQLDGDTASSLEEFGDEQDKVKVAIQGLKNQAVVALLPQLKKLVEGFLEWVKANRVLIRQSLQKVLAGVVMVAKALIKTLGVLILAAQWLAKEWRFMTLLLAGLTAAILVYKAASIGAAIATAAAWIAAAAPFIAIAAAIALIALLAEDIWTWAEGGDSVIGDIHEALVGLFVDAIEFWVKKAQEFFDWFADKWKEVRSNIPEFLGGLSNEESQQFRAQQAGVPNATWNDPELQGVDFFSPEFEQRAAAIQRSSPMQTLSRAVTAHINAPLTINVQGGNPDEIARQIRGTWESLLRTTNAALGAE